MVDSTGRQFYGQLTSNLILFDVLLGVEILPAALRFLAESILGGSELAAKCTKHSRVFHFDSACACTICVAPIEFLQRARCVVY
jgi:hypothetical protein